MGGSNRSVERPRRRLEHRDRRVAFAHGLEEPTAARLHLRGDDLVVAHERLGHRRGIALPQRRRALDVGQAERHHAGRQAAPQPLRRLSTSSPGVAGRRAGSVARPSAQRGLELLGLRGLDALPRRQHARRGRPLNSANAVAASEYTSLARDGTPSAASSGARKPGVPARRRGAAGSRGQAEVHELHAPTLGQDQVRRLDVAVDDGRVLRVQVRERLGRLGEVGEHARRRQTGSAPLAQQPRKVGAVHPVHRHDVPVAVEEVLSHQRQRRMGGNRKQDARLVEQLVAQPLVAHLADLQRDDSVVLAVERLDHVPLAARAERPQHLVAVLDQPSR